MSDRRQTRSPIDPDAGFWRRTPIRGELVSVVAEIAGYRETGGGLKGSVEMASLVVPLVISFGDPFSIALGRAPVESDRWGSFAAGLYAGRVVIDSTGGAACVQIDFTPLGAKRFFGLPMNEIAARMVTLDDLGDRGILALRQRLGEERDWYRRLDLAEAFVVDRLRRAPAVNPAVAWAYRQIVAARGDIRVSRIAGKLGWSRKHLAGRFHTELGLAPKSIARMIRFQHALAVARSSAAADWGDIAVDCGYADQAHLTREFSEFAGASPAQWRAQVV